MSNYYYEVRTVQRPIKCEVEAPGSKSITNRALFLASMARGKSVLSNVLFSGDSRSFLSCLKELGYNIEICEKGKTVEITGGIPLKSGKINVGSAGTGARFMTAMLAVCEGEYFIDASEQMKKRPMKHLFEALKSLGAEFEFVGNNDYLPVEMKGKNLKGGNVALDTTFSSQFLSALLMTGTLYRNGLKIQPTGKEISKSYVGITLKMMEQFGVISHKSSDGYYVVDPGQAYISREYKIEPDVSGACYFYAMAALTGGTVLVKDVHYSSMQGDIKFLDVLKKLGCTIEETDKGLVVQGATNGEYEGIDVDMNDFSDQTMTLAVLAPFASSPTKIRNIGHIRHQESDRIRAVVTELTRMGIKCIEEADGMTIYPGMPKATMVETYEDHRMAMAFSLIGLKVEGVKISNPSCASKTFENYFDVLTDITNSN